MKQIILNFFIIIVLIFSLTSNAGAVSVFKACNNGSLATKTVCSQSNSGNGSSPILKTIKVVLEVLSMIAGVIAVFGLIVAGLRLVTANGDSNSFNSARGAILYVVVGIAIVALSQSVILFVLDKLIKWLRKLLHHYLYY